MSGARYSHHVRITYDLVAPANRCEMMDEANHFVTRERAERPAASAARDNQVTTRRDFKIGQSKRFTLKTDAGIEFFDGRAFAHSDLIIVCVSLRNLLWHNQ